MDGRKSSFPPFFFYLSMPETTKSTRFPFVWLVLALGCLAGFVGLTLAGVYKPGGLCLAGAWFFLAALVRFHPFLKSFSYTIVVLGCVTSSMYFPDFYLHLGGVPTMRFIIPILQVIMFGMGTQLSLRDFQGILKQPWGVLVGLLCQFAIMPLVGYTLAVAFGFEPEIAAGLILIGSVPCGIASNVMNFIARSNIALSVTLTAVATLLAPLTTPFYMKILAGHFVKIEYMKMTAEITNLVILPILAGLMFQTIATQKPRLRSVFTHLIVFTLIIASVNLLFVFSGVFAWNEYSKRLLTQVAVFLVLPMIAAGLLRSVVVRKPAEFDRFLSFFSMVGLLLTIVIINAAGRDHLLQIGLALILACLYRRRNEIPVNGACTDESCRPEECVVQPDTFFGNEKSFCRQRQTLHIFRNIYCRVSSS